MLRHTLFLKMRENGFLPFWKISIVGECIILKKGDYLGVVEVELFPMPAPVW
jgi:hypothetical protein